MLRRSLLLLLCVVASACGDCSDAQPAIVKPPADVSADVTPDMGADLEPTPMLAEIRISPQDPTVEVGDEVTLMATFLDDQGQEVPDTDVSWNITPLVVATITQGGVVTTKERGVAVVTLFHSASIQATTKITITDPQAASLEISPARATLSIGDTLQLGATARDKRGQPLDAFLTWVSDTPNVAVVGAQGLVQAQGAGDAIITATSMNGLMATAEITVGAPPAASLEISTPDPVQLMPGETQQIEVRARDAQGNLLTDRTIDWSMSSPDVASVGIDGLVTALKQGSTTLTASLDGQSDTLVVEVSPPPANALTLTPPRLQMRVGQEETLSAILTDAQGTPLPGRMVSFRSSDDLVATVDASGRVRAVAIGMAEITAEGDGHSDITQIEVLPDVATIALTPGSTDLEPGQTQTFLAVPQDAQGATLNRPVTFAVDPPNIATVSPAGEVTAVAVGAATLRVTSEGIETTAMITVSPPAVPRLTVAPEVVTLFPTDTSQLTIQAFDQNNNVITGRPTSYMSDALGVATVSASGLITAVAQGKAIITIDVEGVTAQVEVVVAVTFERIEAGGDSTCGSLVGGGHYCWGRDQFGVLGNGGNRGDAPLPDPVEGGVDFTRFTMRSIHMCGLNAMGSAYCWGFNGSGQLGFGSNSSRNTPNPVQTSLLFQDISVGAAHTCAIDTSENAQCWGLDDNEQLGTVTTTDNRTPRPVNTTRSFVAIAAGGQHTCAIEKTTNKMLCWGRGDNVGKAGLTSADKIAVPTEVDTAETFTQVDAGPSHVCAVTTAGEIMCWGENGDGQLGNGNMMRAQTPTKVVSAQTFVEVKVGTTHSCARSTTGDIYCWGANNNRQLGDDSGNTNSNPTPVKVVGGLLFGSLSVGRAHACGVATNGIAYCWGSNFEGKLGDGTTMDRGRPFPVVVP